MSVRREIKRVRCRIRRALGVPRLRGRTWLLILVAFLGVLCLGAWMADVATTFGQYAPRFYEPKDFSRQRFLEGTAETQR